jgi:hypothetical protein
LEISKKGKGLFRWIREKIKEINPGIVFGTVIIWLAGLMLLVIALPFVFFNLGWMIKKAVRKESAEMLKSPVVVVFEGLFAVYCYVSLILL